MQSGLVNYNIQRFQRIVLQSRDLDIRQCLLVEESSLEYFNQNEFLQITIRFCYRFTAFKTVRKHQLVAESSNNYLHNEDHLPHNQGSRYM
jgi:hypothetical protein